MENSKFKAFVKRNKVVIIGGGAVSLAVGVGYYIYMKGFSKGVNYAVDPMFQGTIEWFDKTFDNLHLRELWNQWAEAHPEQVVYPK